MTPPTTDPWPEISARLEARIERIAAQTGRSGEHNWRGEPPTAWKKGIETLEQEAADLRAALDRAGRVEAVSRRPDRAAVARIIQDGFLHRHTWDAMADAILDLPAAPLSDADLLAMARAHFEAGYLLGYRSPWEQACTLPGWRDEQLAQMRAALEAVGR